MVLVDLLVKVAEALDRARIWFVLFGGMAISTWIEPRLTKDCDIVVMARKRDVSRLKEALVSAGVRVTALEMRWLFEKRWVRWKMDGHILDIHIAVMAHDRSAFSNARPVDHRGRKVMVARPENLILYKLKAWRGQDQLDCIAVVRQVKDLDWDYIDSWLDTVAKDCGQPIRDRWTDVLKRAAGPE